MNHKAFTLIELLISITIFSIIMASLYPIFVQITTFNQENYIRTILIDNLRVGMDRITRELREALEVEINEDGNEIIFLHPNPQNPSNRERIRYRLSESSYTIKTFPNCKQISRDIWNGKSWEGANPITEPIVSDIIFKRSCQLIKVCIISNVQLRLKSNPQEYIYLGSVSARNALP